MDRALNSGSAASTPSPLSVLGTNPDALPLTARLCRSCGASFHVGHERHDDKGNQFKCSLDFHCGKPTVPAPAFDAEFEERHRLLREWVSTNVSGTPQPASSEWWSG